MQKLPAGERNAKPLDLFQAAKMLVNVILTEEACSAFARAASRSKEIKIMPLPVFNRINLQFATSCSEKASVPADSRRFFSEQSLQTRYGNYDLLYHKITMSQRFEPLEAAI